METSLENSCRGQNWDNIQHSEASEIPSDNEERYLNMSSDEEYDDTGTYGDTPKTDADAKLIEDSPIQSPPLLTVGDVQRALHPLQATADRVGKQVEQFAETLDRLSTKSQRKPQDCQHILPLVQTYRQIAHDAVLRMKSAHTPEKPRQTTQKWKRKLRSSSGSLSPSLSESKEISDLASKTTIEDLKRWEQEEHTWSLLDLMLRVEYPTLQPDPQKPVSEQDLIRPSKDSEVHPYSSEKEVWDHFLAEDDLAWERHTVVEWLRKCADSSRQDIDLVIKELESDADRGSGLWAHSWLYTKEAIKAQKRLRSWPRPLELDAPGNDASFPLIDRGKGLITQLDPDAITRQDRSLEKQDFYFERAMWLACWEMVRRGKSWDYIREWCRERVEGWRAIVVRGDPRYSHTTDSQKRDGRSLIATWQSRALWRKTCAIAAKDGCVDKYENAVYGVLSGHLPSVKAVSSTWDDYLFAHYNSYLMRQFDRYVKSKLLDRLPTALVDKQGSFKTSVALGQRALSGNQIIQKMKAITRTGREAREPLKMLQGSLIAKAFDEFIFVHGVQLARSANRSEKSKILPSVKPTQTEEGAIANITLNDHDLLRIVTHMLFIFQDLGLDIGQSVHQIAAENFVVAYIDYLSKAGKQQLLPLYASRLSAKRSISCLGRQLPLIRDYNERQTTMRLMKQSGIDIPGVLSMQLQLIIADNPPEGVNSTDYPKLNVLEPTKDKKSMVHQIRKGFLGESITDDEQDLINGYEWYLLLDGHWQQTMTIGAVLYKHLLRTKGLAAARELSATIPFSRISTSKTPGITGRTEDISRNLENSDDDGDPKNPSKCGRSRQVRSRRRRGSSSARRAQNERQLLLHQSRTFRDFEALFAILNAMEEWKDIADQANSFANLRHDGKTWRATLQKAYEKVDTLIKPLLHGWLQYPKDDEEAAEFEKIRVACLPEVVLAYNTILNYSGYSISRDLLLKCMDLAALVAAEDSDLAGCFLSAGRMPELLDSLALSSRNMIQAEERGHRAKSRRKLDGGTLDLWIAKSTMLS